MSESKNELVEVQIESVEGEYLSARDYDYLQMEQMQEQAIKEQEEHRQRIKRHEEEMRIAQINLQEAIFANMFK